MKDGEPTVVVPGVHNEAHGDKFEREDRIDEDGPGPEVGYCRRGATSCATIVIAVATAANVLVAVAQWRVTSAAINEATKANSLAREALEASQRPFVLVESVAQEGDMRSGGKARVWVKNFGNGPASIVQIRLTHQLLKAGQALPTIQPLPSFGILGFDLGPGQARGREFFAPPITEDEEGALDRLMIAGYVTYADQFGNRFCKLVCRTYLLGQDGGQSCGVEEETVKLEDEDEDCPPPPESYADAAPWFRAVVLE